MNQNMIMAAFTVRNTINSAGVWQEENFMELNVVMSQFKGGRETGFETNIRLGCRNTTVHVGPLTLSV